MNVNRIFSAGRAPESPEQVQELLKNIITITNYLPGVRTGLGWRGVFRIPYEDETWTLKAAGFDGIFGIDYIDSEERNGSLISLFNLYYFPDPDEEVIEKFPINGAVYAFRDDYRELIRKFPELPEFYNYFFTGKMTITFKPGNQAIVIQIESLSEDIIISEDGVIAINSGKEKYLVLPGEPEQLIPSYQLASAVFDLLVSSLCFHLKSLPVAVRLRQYPAEKRYLKGDIIRAERVSGDVTLNSLAVLFSDIKSEIIKEFLSSDKKHNELNEILWSAGAGSLPDVFSQFAFMKSGDIKNTTSLNTNLLGIETRPPLYIVSGFLGAGKTTFIKNFLEFQSQKYLYGAVIQNELGEAGLDGKIISDECRVVEMDEGCVCCTLSGNLRKGVKSILSEFTPDFIILETTGAANPINLISEIHELKDLIKFDSVTTIVDAANIVQSLKDYDIAKEQIKSADIIILNKTDRLSEIEIKQTIEVIEKVNKRAIIEISDFGRINPSLIYYIDVDDLNVNPEMTFIHHNHKTHSDDNISSVTLKLPDSFDRSEFIKKIEQIPFSIFRIKGILKFNNEINFSVFQSVVGRYEISQHAGNIESPFLVLIGKNIDEDGVNEYFRL